jgi:hypothetical protein
MKEYRLLQIMRVLTGDDIRQFRRYVKADYFKHGSPVLSLFNWLIRFHPEMKGSLIDEEKLFKQVFPGEEFDEKKLRRLRSKLKKALEDFLAYQNWRSDPFRYQQDLVQAYRKRKNAELYWRSQQKAIQYLQSEMPNGVIQHQEIADIYRQLYFHPYSKSVDAKRGDFRLSEMTKSVSEAYLLMILQLACEIQIMKRVNRSAEDQFLLELAHSMLKLDPERSSPLVKLYAALYQTFLESVKWDQIDRLRKDIVELHNEGKTAYYDLALAYKILVNQIIHPVKKVYEVHPLFFLLIEEGIQIGLYLEDGKLSYNRFLNIIILMIRYSEFDRAKNFILRFQDQLPKNIRESAVSLAFAYWNYHFYLEHKKINFLEEALSHTLWVTNKHLLIEVRFRSIRLRIIFELFLRDMTDRFELQKEIRNFQHYLKESKDFSRRHSYGRLVKWIQKLATWKNKARPALSRLNQYQLQIEKSPEPIELKGWLLNKVKNMSGFGI